MIYIDESTIETAKQNADKALKALQKAIANNEDIRALTADYIQKSSDYRTFLNARYNLY